MKTDRFQIQKDCIMAATQKYASRKFWSRISRWIKIVLGNLIMAPMKLKKMPEMEARKRALGLLDKVGIRDKAEVYPSMLSRVDFFSEQIARALGTESVFGS